MAQLYPAARGAGWPGRTLLLVVLAVLLVAGGAALVFGVTPTTTPLDASYSAERNSTAETVPTIFRAELIDCEPIEEDPPASAPER